MPLAFHPQIQHSTYSEIISPSNLFRFGTMSKLLLHCSRPQCNDLVSKFLLYFERIGDAGLRVWESILLTLVWLLSCSVAFSCLNLLPSNYDSARKRFSLPRSWSLTTLNLLCCLLNKHPKKEQDKTPNAIFVASFGIMY